jgi:RNA polymerase sigma factor for flagellar operon FliA
MRLSRAPHSHDMDTGAQSLWEAFRALRDAASRERLIEHYMPLARIWAAKMYRMRIDESSTFDDYLQFARVGLIESVNRYDAARNACFETYSSYRIRGAILNGIQHSSEAAAQRSFWRTHVQDRVHSLEEGLTVRLEQATLNDLADFAVELALGFVLDSGRPDMIDESPQTNPYAAVELADFARVVKDLVGKLPPREREVIEAHYFEQIEFQVLAERYAVTKGRVSQLHARALARLRELLREQPKLDRKV